MTSGCGAIFILSTLLVALGKHRWCILSKPSLDPLMTATWCRLFPSLFQRVPYPVQLATRILLCKPWGVMWGLFYPIRDHFEFPPYAWWRHIYRVVPPLDLIKPEGIPPHHIIKLSVSTHSRYKRQHDPWIPCVLVHSSGKRLHLRYFLGHRTLANRNYSLFSQL